MASAVWLRGFGVWLGITALAAVPLVPRPGAGMELSAAATGNVLAQMTLSRNAEQLDNLHLSAAEQWTADKASDDDLEMDSVFFYRGVPIEIATANNGKPLSAKAAANEQRNAAKVRVKIDRLGNDPGQLGRMLNLDGEVWTLPCFLAQFNWTARPGPAWQGHSTVRLHFIPKPQLPAGSRMQRILRMSEGDVDVDAGSGQLLRGSFHSLGAVKYGGGLLADIGSFTGQFEMQPDGDCWVMKRIEVTVAGREILHRFHGKEVMTYTPVTAAAAVR